MFIWSNFIKLLCTIVFFKINLKLLIFESCVRTTLRLKTFISSVIFIVMISGKQNILLCLDFDISFIFEI